MDDIHEPTEHDADHDADIESEGDEEKAARSEKMFNRAKLASVVTEKTGLPRAKAMAAIEAVFEAMSHSLKEGLEVRMVNFGAFVVTERKGGKGRDPRTGAEIQVPESKTVRFRAGKALRDQVADTPVDSARHKRAQPQAGG